MLISRILSSSPIRQVWTLVCHFIRPWLANFEGLCLARYIGIRGVFQVTRLICNISVITVFEEYQ